VNQGLVQYDAVAHAYARLVAPRYAPIAALLDAAVGSVAAGSIVVELAAGTGALTSRVAPRVLAKDGRYVAVDISAGMLRQARAVVDSRVRLVVADGDATGLGTSSADLVLSSLGVLQDTDEGWREAARLLRSHGRVVLTMWGVDYAERDLIAEARRLLGGPPLPATPVIDAVDRASRAGFRSVRRQDVRLPVVHDSMEDYLRYRAAFGVPPWVPPGREQDAVDAVRTAAARHVNQDGQVVLDWNVTVLEAEVDELFGPGWPGQPQRRTDL
jgi:SAM-dependent methyltransferase